MQANVVSSRQPPTQCCCQSHLSPLVSRMGKPSSHSLILQAMCTRPSPPWGSLGLLQFSTVFLVMRELQLQAHLEMLWARAEQEPTLPSIHWPRCVVSCHHPHCQGTLLLWPYGRHLGWLWLLVGSSMLRSHQRPSLRHSMALSSCGKRGCSHYPSLGEPCAGVWDFSFCFFLSWNFVPSLSNKQ